VSVPGSLSGLNAKFYLTEWSGINALIYYGPLLMRSLGFNGHTVNLLVAGGINIVQFLAVLPAILYIDKLGGWLERSILFDLRFLFWIGRKPLLRGGSAVMTIAHLSIALMVYLLFVFTTNCLIRRSGIRIR
jgi:hypothetical protein